MNAFERFDLIHDFQNRQFLGITHQDKTTVQTTL
jgi:hypothetical protein